MILPFNANKYIIICNVLNKGKTNLNLILFIRIINRITIKLIANDPPFPLFNMQVITNTNLQGINGIIYSKILEDHMIKNNILKRGRANLNFSFLDQRTRFFNMVQGFIGVLLFFTIIINFLTPLLLSWLPSTFVSCLGSSKSSISSGME